MKDVLISIIVPVYNVEKYLGECVDSIINQTYKNLEIILVDDGSTDNSGKICDEYAVKDKRISVIHKINSGVADSRNIGLKTMNGEFVFFVDSDDFIEENAIKILVETAIKNNADIVCAENISIGESKNIDSIKEYDFENIDMNMIEAMNFYAQKEWAPWNRLIRTEIHKNIYFPNYKIHEDEAIKFKLLERCNRVIQISAITYYYRQREGSITHLNSKTDRMDMFYSGRENIYWLRDKYPAIEKLFLVKVCEDALYNLGQLCNQENIDIKTNRIHEIVDFAKEYKYKIIANKFCPISYKLRVFFICISNWEKDNCLYIKFYDRLRKIRNHEK